MRNFLMPVLLALASCSGSLPNHEYGTMLGDVRRDAGPRASDIIALTTATQLDRAALVAAVLARNPDLEAARAMYRAAVAGYPSVTGLPDPMVRYEVAPFSIGAGVPFGQRAEVSQKLPFPGKRELDGAAALAGADAARADYAALRLELAEAAVDAFDDYYVAVRALEVNSHHRELLERIENSARAQYTVGRASQQDPLEARTQVIVMDRDRLMLQTQHRTAIARINQLLHRKVDAELPPPPARLDVTTASARTSEMHPKQVAAQARIRMRDAEAGRANRELYPDIEVMASYDSMWDVWQHRWMVGVGIEIPLQRGKRQAAIERVEADRAKATADLESVTSHLDEERDRASREVAEALQLLEIDEKQLLPTTRERVDAALIGFTTGQTSFSTVMMAEHALRHVELEIEEMRASLDRRNAALARAEGRLPGGGK